MLPEQSFGDFPYYRKGPCGDLVDRIGRPVMVRIVEIDDVDDPVSRLKQRHVIVGHCSLLHRKKNTVMSESFRASRPVEYARESYR